MKVLIAAGGTGGHLYPGIAIARQVLQRPGDEVLFAGTEQGIEARVLPREGLPVRFIPAGKLKGMGTVARLRTVLAMPSSIVRSALLLRRERPDVVIGIGGYASGPVALAAWLLGKPLVIVEPNSHAGLANRILGRFARRIFLCFPGRDRQGFFPASRKVLAGPLVRAGIGRGDADRTLAEQGLEPGRFTVLVMGGSGGAHAINMAMKDAAPELGRVQGLQVLHQTGEKDVQEVSAAYRDAGIKATVVPYLQDMPGVYAAADLVVCRSGATTVAELAVCGKRAILVPYPFAADDHQAHNAHSLAERGAADVVLQKDLTPQRLAALIAAAAAKGRRTVVPMAGTAAEEIAGECRTYVQED